MQSYRVIPRTARDQLGEGLLWSARENAVYWVDILAPALHRLSLTDESVSTWPLPEKIGWVIERRDRPGFIAGLQSVCCERTLDPVVCRVLFDPEPHYPNNRMNDAAVDHLGRIWAGTMDCGCEIETGSLYCLGSDFQITCCDSGYIVTNGPVFSPGGDYLYHSDTGRGVMYRFACGADGEIRDKSEFLKFPQDWVLPDGMTVETKNKQKKTHKGGARV